MIRLYDLAVPTFTRTARAIDGVLAKAEAHFVDSGLNPDDVVTARLIDDMAPLHFQIEALTHHAVWGLEAVKTRTFAPSPLFGAMPFPDLRAIVGSEVTALEAFTPDELNSLSGKTLEINLFRPVDEDNSASSAWAPRAPAFTSETFLLTYSLPNFHFHAVTAYNILRSRDVPLGKRDYEGRLRSSQLQCDA